MSTVVATAVIRAVQISTGVTIVTSASGVKPSRHTAVEAPPAAPVKFSAATLSTSLGKDGQWREAKRNTCDDYAKNGRERKFRH